MANAAGDSTPPGLGEVLRSKMKGSGGAFQMANAAGDSTPPGWVATCGDLNDDTKLKVEL